MLVILLTKQLGVGGEFIIKEVVKVKCIYFSFNISHIGGKDAGCFS